MVNRQQQALIDAQKLYVTTMMDVIGRGLASTSQVDEDVRRELAAFPAGYVLQMVVLPSGPSFTAQVQGDGTLALLKNHTGKVDLNIKFKHMAHAFLVFSFQEGTARAFANDRMLVDGDVSHAIRLVRCLNKMEALILPKPVAKLAVKRYPELGLVEKASKAARIYGLVAKNFVLGN